MSPKKMIRPKKSPGTKSSPPLDYREEIYASYAEKKRMYEKDFNVSQARHWSQATRSVIEKYLPESKEASILDAGCGSGFNLFLLKESGYTNLEGVDISPDQVRLARQVCDRVTEGNLFEFLSKHRHSYDLILAFDIIEHLTKSEFMRFVTLCRECLKPEGRMIISTPNAESPWGMTYRYGDFTHEICFDPESLRHMLSLGGFKIVRFLERGPVVHGLKSLVRWSLWRMISLALRVWNLAETGSAGSGVYTRVFLTVAQKEPHV